MKRKIISFISLVAVMGIVFGTMYALVQQDIRQSANDPQIGMAENAAQMLDNGADPALLVRNIQSPFSMDAASSTAPFLAIFDKSGVLLESSAMLNGKALPAPPAGVFAYISGETRDNKPWSLRQSDIPGEDRVTWQPTLSVRIAAVIVSYDNGYVLAGRNMRDVEMREQHVGKIAFWGWIISVIMIAGGLWIMGRY